MPSSPDQNGVVERISQTLVDMVMSMRSNNNVPQFLWIEALKTTMYILNLVPTKAVQRHHLSYSKVRNSFRDIYA